MKIPFNKKLINYFSLSMKIKKKSDVEIFKTSETFFMSLIFKFIKFFLLIILLNNLFPNFFF